ncbi:MAG: proline iminopeptidase-family hydrolase [Actinomycetales bacterium]|nr:proline iminopeptidase-family hydrolase [Actinomycetales bacterium]
MTGSADGPRAVPAQFDGYLDVRGFRTWYRVAGDLRSGRVPVILLHGGPGYPSSSLEPMEGLALTGRAVVRYDQLGCGASSLKDVPHDPAMFEPGLYVEELALLVNELGLDRYALIGQSWGGMLALEAALTNPPGLIGMVLYSSLASIEEWKAATDALIATLPEEARVALQDAARTGRIDTAEFRAAEHEFNRRFVCRLDPMPEPLRRSEASLEEDGEVYRVMAGGSEFDNGAAMGVLHGWDVRSRLAEIDVPVLCLSGEHDEATPAVMGTLAEGIAGAEWHVLASASHNSHVEAPHLFYPLVSDFLARLDGGRA